MSDVPPRYVRHIGPITPEREHGLREAWAAILSAVASLDKWGSPGNTDRLLRALVRQRNPAHRPVGSHGIDATRSLQLLLHVLENPEHSGIAVARNLDDRGDRFSASLEATAKRIDRIRAAVKQDGREAVIRKALERVGREKVGLSSEDARKMAEVNLPLFQRLGVSEGDIN
jgi:hypothetical protein